MTKEECFNCGTTTDFLVARDMLATRICKCGATWLPAVKKPNHKKIAKIIVSNILDDMRGRAGGDDWFDGCDYEIQDEIIEAWQTIVLDELEKSLK